MGLSAADNLAIFIWHKTSDPISAENSIDPISVAEPTPLLDFKKCYDLIPLYHL